MVKKRSQSTSQRKGRGASTARAVMDNSSRGGGARLPLNEAASRYFAQQEPGGGAMRRPLTTYNPASQAYRPPQQPQPQQQQQRFNPVASNRFVASQAPQWPTSNNNNFAAKRSFASEYQEDFHSQASRLAKTAQNSKGLRHFSAKVCEKVKEKGRTNYNEVADELVNEYFDSLNLPINVPEKHSYDVKNIRRRVYDALNVLIAMNIVEKERKEIRWVGLPDTSADECRKLQEEKAIRAERIKEKTDSLLDRVMELVAYKSLVEKNRERERMEGRPADGTSVYLPFVTVSTDKRSQVDWSVNEDRTKFKFSFEEHFQIQEDIEVLKRLGFAQGMETAGGAMSEEMLHKIKGCLPNALRGYVDPIIEGSFAPMQQAYSRELEEEQEHDQKPVFTLSAPQQQPQMLLPVAVARPIARPPARVLAPPLHGQQQTARPSTVAPPPPLRFVPAHSVLQQQQRYVPAAGGGGGGGAAARQQQPQERYAYANPASSTGRSVQQQQHQQQQYSARQLYAPAQQPQYEEDVYDDEEEGEGEYQI